MIKIVRKVVIESLSFPELAPVELPIVPASAVIDSKETADEGGRLSVYDFRAVVSSSFDMMRHDLKVRVYFDGCSRPLSLGSRGLPVRMEMSAGNSVQVSFSYKKPCGVVLS